MFESNLCVCFCAGLPGSGLLHAGRDSRLPGGPPGKTFDVSKVMRTTRTDKQTGALSTLSRRGPLPLGPLVLKSHLGSGWVVEFWSVDWRELKIQRVILGSLVFEVKRRAASSERPSAK